MPPAGRSSLNLDAARATDTMKAMTPRCAALSAIPPHAQAAASSPFDLRAEFAKRPADGRVWSVGIERKDVAFGGQW